MSLAIVAANAPSFGDWLSPGLSPRLDQGARPVSVLNPRNTSTPGNNTVTMFLDVVSDDFAYGASVITACVDQTVYAIQCTSGPDNVGPETCGPNAVIGTLTSGSSIYEFSSSLTSQTLGYEFTATVQETCSQTSTTAAACTASLRATIDGTSSSSVTVRTLSDTNYHRFNVEITGGSEKTASAIATCGVKGAASRSLSAKRPVIWALAGAIGVAGILIA